MDDRALLAAVLADPDDDLPRLAYADWLDEHGDDARAEFIRSQIELTRTPRTEDRHAQLAARCRTLEVEHGRDWLASCPLKERIGNFERGFPQLIHGPGGLPHERVLTGEDFAGMTRATEIFPIRIFSGPLLGAASPSITRFPQQSLYPGRGDSPLERLARWEPLARFTTLDLGMGCIASGYGDFQPGLAALAESLYSSRLTTLRLSGLLLGEDAVQVLDESAHLTNLRALDVRYNVPLQDRPGAILETSLADRLEEIDGIDLETAGRWLRRPGCRLRELGITLDPHNDHPSVTDAGPLVEAPGLTGLRRLSLFFDGPAAWQSRQPERDEVIRVIDLMKLLSSPLLSRLEELQLCGVALADEDVMALAGLPMARNLVSLELRRSTLHGPVPWHLGPMLTEDCLRRVKLSYNYLTTGDAATLACWPDLARLHELRLECNDIDVTGFDAILDSPYRRPWLSLSG